MKHHATPSGITENRALAVCLTVLLAITGLSCQAEAGGNSADESAMISDDLSSVARMEPRGYLVSDFHGAIPQRRPFQRSRL